MMAALLLATIAATMMMMAATDTKGMICIEWLMCCLNTVRAAKPNTMGNNTTSNTDNIIELASMSIH